MIIRDEKSELLQIISTIPVANIRHFGYGVSIDEVYRAFTGPRDLADIYLRLLERDGKIEIFPKPDVDNMILAVRIK